MIDVRTKEEIATDEGLRCVDCKSLKATEANEPHAKYLYGEMYKVMLCALCYDNRCGDL